MLAEIGNFSLVLALCLAVLQILVAFAGLRLASGRLLLACNWVVFAQLSFLGLAYALLTWSFISNDFSIAYVAQNSNFNLPTMYKISGVWGGHEGSMLLWVLLLSCWGAAVALLGRSLPIDLQVRVLAVLGMVSAAFFGLYCFFF